jgi:rhamnulokinase
MARDVPLHLALDLGAGSGRAMVGGIGPAGLTLREAHRFHYTPRSTSGHLRWDFDSLIAGIKDGIRASPSVAAELGGRIESIAVDSWGVDYGLVDAEGRLLEEPISYRDERLGARTFLPVPAFRSCPSIRCFNLRPTSARGCPPGRPGC